jgi:hypothetical protein
LPRSVFESNRGILYEDYKLENAKRGSSPTLDLRGNDQPVGKANGISVAHSASCGVAIQYEVMSPARGDIYVARVAGLI